MEDLDRTLGKYRELRDQLPQANASAEQRALRATLDGLIRYHEKKREWRDRQRSGTGLSVSRPPVLAELPG